MRRGSKNWWAMSRRLLHQKGQVCSIPALRNNGGEWVLDCQAKAKLFAESFSSKFVLVEEEQNAYSELDDEFFKQRGSLPTITEEKAKDTLAKLREDSGTGPDLLPARILKQCAAVLAKPVQMLTLCILSAGVWPELWLQHWITPLFKLKNVFLPANYRGIHLTAQLSKVVERLLKSLYTPYISTISGFGPRQFAYTIGRGARDALALMVLTWVQALAAGMRIAVYCSDVAGAFDRVPMKRLVAKLRSKGFHPKLVDVLSSWLRQRVAQVVVGGSCSDDMPLSDMVFQGTVTGPSLWNLFFADARKAINEWWFTEIVYADDLNGYRIFSSTTSNEIIEACIPKCQQELHTWGRANQVSFDPAKESSHILSLTSSVGVNFKMLGIIFDGALSMEDAVAEVVTEAGWKLRTLIRTRRYYCDGDLIGLYKAHILSYLEYRTPAIYHGTRDVLVRLDSVQTKFLRDVGVDEVTALMEFNLAPLRMRRDIAMLGVLHRAALGEGPPQLKELFQRRPGSFMLEDRFHVGPMHPLVKRSAWGLVPVYNKLGSGAQTISSVKLFQQYLQERVKSLIGKGMVSEDPAAWCCLYSPR